MPPESKEYYILGIICCAFVNITASDDYLVFVKFYKDINKAFVTQNCNHFEKPEGCFRKEMAILLKVSIK